MTFINVLIQIIRVLYYDLSIVVLMLQNRYCQGFVFATLTLTEDQLLLYRKVLLLYPYILLISECERVFVLYVAACFSPAPSLLLTPLLSRRHLLFRHTYYALILAALITISSAQSPIACLSLIRQLLFSSPLSSSLFRNACGILLVVITKYVTSLFTEFGFWALTYNRESVF